MGFASPIIKVQVNGSDCVDDLEVSALSDKVAPGEFGLLVTSGTFTNQARILAQAKSNLRLIDGEKLLYLVLQFREQFDSRCKRLLPFVRRP